MARSAFGDPQRFFRIACISTCLVQAVYAVALPRIWPKAYADFTQYYSGGLHVRVGRAAQMYPIPNGTPLNPGWAEGSTLRPASVELHRQYGVPLTDPRFIQPPLDAVPLEAVSLLPYRIARPLWGVLLVSCLALAAVQAGRIYTRFAGRPTVAAGVVVLVLGLAPRTFISGLFGNASNLVPCLLGLFLTDLLACRQRTGPAALFVAGTVKSAVAPLALVYAILGRWKNFYVYLGAAVVLVLLTLPLTGVGAWRDYWHLSAAFDHVYGDAPLSGFLATLLHRDADDHILKWGTRLGVSLPIIGVTFILARRGNAAERPAAAAAVSLVVLCAALIASPIFWQHYLIFVFPWLGWIAFETTAERRMPWLGALVFVLVLLPIGPVLRKLAGEPWDAYPLFACLAMIGYGLVRLFQCGGAVTARQPAREPVPLPAA